MQQRPTEYNKNNTKNGFEAQTSISRSCDFGTKIYKKFLWNSTYLLVLRLSACNNSKTDKMIFVKIHIAEFH